MRGRLIKAFVALVSVMAVSSVVFYLLGGGAWALKDCVYFTIITITTVGYSESLPGFSEVAYAREVTAIVLLSGMGTALYFVSTLTASIVEGDLRREFRRKRMLKELSKLEDHIIVCGAGSTGANVIAELMTASIDTVVIEHDQERIDSLIEHFGDRKLKYVCGDATDDELLQEAHVASARGVVCALANDKDNLYLVVTARQANPTAKIVARGSDLPILDKLRRAGADSVVSPNYIGGLRMVSELIRPEAVRFLDEMMRDPESDMRIQEVHVGERAKVVGTKLRDTRIREESELLVLAIKRDDGSYHFSPSADFVVEGGMTLVVMGSVPKVQHLQDRFGG